MVIPEAVAVVLQFALATLLPVLASVLISLNIDRPPLSNMGYWPKQILFGVIFGLIAVFGTEFGIDTQGATMNVRDAAPIVAGLYFGGPAGVIAGLIGGIERWFAVYWGAGMFTRVACSVATAAMGFYAALLSRYLFSDRKPSWGMALSAGIVAEVLHLLLVFATNPTQITHAFEVVRVCTAPMILCNGISVALSGAAVAYVTDKDFFRTKHMRDISQTIQGGMLGVVAIGFLVAVGIMFILQQSITNADSLNDLKRELSEIKADIHDASDSNLLSLTRRAAQEIGSTANARNVDLAALCDELDVSEVFVIDANGIVCASNDPTYVGFDMSSGEQSSEFLGLLPSGRSTYYVQDYQPMAADSNVWRKMAGVRIEGGFVQVSYDSSQFLDDIASRVKAAVANRHVGADGLIVVTAQDGKLVGSRKDFVITSAALEGLLRNASEYQMGELFKTDLNGSDYYAIHEDVEGFHAVSLLPVVEAVQDRDLAVLVTSYLLVLVFAALFAAIYILVRRVVVRSIWQVNGTLDQITSGNLEAQVDVRNSSEFSSLSDDINRTVTALRDAIVAEGKRIENDLATAKAIQSSALPCTFPPFPDVHAFDIYASMNPAREVGGDFYDFFLIGDHTLGFLIADVSGKGIPAALFMMAAKSDLSNYMNSGMDLAEAVHSANWGLCRGNDAGMFVTVWAATLDYETGLLTYVNAGHNPPLLRHNGKWEWLREKGGLFLGTFEMAKYRSCSLQLEPGDELLLYTDGVNEAFSANDEEYGNDRLEQFLSRHANMHPHLLVDSLRADVRKWAKGAVQSDDITILCLEYGVPPEVIGHINVQATDAGLSELMRHMHFELSQLQCPDTIQRHLDLTVEELFCNVCEHGYAESEEPGDVELSYVYNSDPSSIVMTMVDWGMPFDPIAYRRSDDDDGDVLTGIGVALALKNVDDAAYVRDGDRNVFAFRKDW